MDIAAIIPVQQGGNDLIRNALAPFGPQGIPLITWKIKQLKEVVPVANIYVSTYSEEIKALAAEEGVNIHHRSKEITEESKGPFGDVIFDVVKDIEHEYIAWVSTVVPFMGEYDYRQAFDAFEKQVHQGQYDSLMTVNRVFDYLWSEDQPLNYQPDSSQPKRTELPATYKVTNGLFMRSREGILANRYYVGSTPFKFEVKKLAGLDINAQEDLDVASALAGIYRKQESERRSVVFLDFDGVIFDSVIEAYAIAMLTSQKIATLAELDTESEHAKRFFAQRYLVGPAWNYYYLLKAIENDTDDEFATYLPGEPGQEAKDFQAAFFATRQVMRNNFWDEWLSLNRIYSGSEEFIDLLNNNRNIVILTTKDQPTVKALLDCYGLRRSIDIYDAKSYEKFGEKSNFIDEYIRSNNIKKALFVDDSLRHLEKCSWIESLDVIQARWGYVSAEIKEDNMKEVFHKIEEVIEIQL